MPFIAKTRSLLRNLFQARRMESDLNEEIRAHMEMLAEENMRAGMTPDEAGRAARIEAGDSSLIKEQVREAHIGAWLRSVLTDFRYALRGLVRNPVFAATAILSLSLAIGANTAIFSIADAALLRPLHVPQPNQLVILAASGDDQPGGATAGSGELFSYPLYQQLRQAAGDSARIALFGSPANTEAQVSEADGPYEQVVQQYVSPDAFNILSVPPALGQLLSPRDDFYPSPRAVVVLSYSYWLRRYGADANVLGRNLILDGRKYSIIGVARKGFSGSQPGKFVDVWLPTTLMDPNIFVQPQTRLFHLMGRLSPGVNREQLAARLQPAFHHREDARLNPESGVPAAMRKQLQDMNLVALSGANGIAASWTKFTRPLWILLGVSVCILLIACANVASLLLARSTARSAEMALRISLGARRARLLRQLLSESLLISFMAGLTGWVLARAAAPALLAMVSTNGDRLQLDLALNSSILLFCIGLCTLSALFFGLLPAWQASGAGTAMLALRQAHMSTGRMRLGRLFVGVQIAFAFCLVTAGAGFLFSLRNLAAVKTGFDPRGVTVLSVDNTRDRNLQLEKMRQLEVQVAASPNIESTSTGWMAIFSGARRAQRVVLPGSLPSQQEETFYRVSPNYFATLHTPLLSGRDFTIHDNDNEPVPTVVNRAFAMRYYGTDAVLGKQFRRDDGVLHQIVGLAADSIFDNLRKGAAPIAYMPMKPGRVFTMYVRSTLDPASVAAMVDREAKSLGSGMRVRDVTTVDALVESTIVNERLLASIGGAFAILGLVLVAIGLFGLLNYSVVRRTKEFGIRAALGARRSSIYLLVLKDVLGMTTAGIAAGLAGAIVLMRFTQSLLFGVGPTDPLIIGTAIAMFAVTAAIAAGLPARRAARIDPMIALRYE